MSASDAVEIEVRIVEMVGLIRFGSLYDWLSLGAGGTGSGAATTVTEVAVVSVPGTLVVETG